MDDDWYIYDFRWRIRCLLVVNYITDYFQWVSEANFYIDGSKINSVSDDAGNFSFYIQNQNSAALIFQKNGYETSIVKISDVIGKKVKVILLRIQKIEEMVLIAYIDAAY